MEELPTLSKEEGYTEVTNKKKRTISATSYPNVHTYIATSCAEALTSQDQPSKAPPNIMDAPSDWQHMLNELKQTIPSSRPSFREEAIHQCPF